MTATRARGRARVRRLYSRSAMRAKVAGEDEVKDNGPADDLEAGEDDGQDGAYLGRMDEAARGVPVANREEQRHGCGDEGQVKNEQRQNGQSERNAVIANALVLEFFDFALFTARFQAGRAEVLAVQFAIAKRAEKPAATLSGEHGLLLGVIKTTCFAIHQDGFSLLPRSGPAEQGGKDLDLQRNGAGGAGR